MRLAPLCLLLLQPGCTLLFQSPTELANAEDAGIDGTALGNGAAVDAGCVVVDEGFESIDSDRSWNGAAGAANISHFFLSRCP